MLSSNRNPTSKGRGDRGIHWVGKVVAGLCVLLLLGACTRGTTPSVNGTRPGQPERGGILNMLGSGDVDYMDPNVSYYSVGYLGLRMWSRQFFTYPAEEGKTTTAVPDLATALPTKANGGVSDDGKTYTITIRKGVKWNTDPQRQVTAADAVRGLKRTCNPVQPFGGIPNFSDLIVGYAAFCEGFASVPQNAKAIADYITKNDIPGLTTKGERTVVFTLTHPATYFVAMLTLPAFSPAPVEFLRYAPASRQLAQNTISNGPYQIRSYTPTKRIEFERNPAWDPATDPVRKAYVDEIIVDQTVSQESTQQQLETASAGADMEWDNYPPPSALPGLIASQDPNLHLGPTGSTNPYLVFNNLSPNNGKALTKPAVRQAIAYAIHRGNLIQALGGPKVNKPLTHVLPSTILGSTNFNPYPYNPANTRKLFAKAKIKPGMTLKMLYRNESEGGRKVFATLQQNLQEVGIRLVGVAVPNADFYTKYVQVPTVARRGVWDIALASWGPDWYGNAALSFFGPLFAGTTSYPPTGSNFGFYTSKATNRLVQLAATATTPEAAAELWAQADRQVMKEAAIYPITNPLQPNYHASQVRNAVYIPALQNFDPTNVWLEPGRRGG
jgi:peptide/nickel transport system substrate-binding protein